MRRHRGHGGVGQRHDPLKPTLCSVSPGRGPPPLRRRHRTRWRGRLTTMAHLRRSRATALPGSHLTPRGEAAGRDVPAFFEWLFCAIEHRGWVQRCILAFCHGANRVMRQWVSDDVAVIVSTYPLARPGTGPAQGDRPDPATRCHLPHRPRRPPTMGAPGCRAPSDRDGRDRHPGPRALWRSHVCGGGTSAASLRCARAGRGARRSARPARRRRGRVLSPPGQWVTGVISPARCGPSGPATALGSWCCVGATTICAES